MRSSCFRFWNAVCGLMRSFFYSCRWLGYLGLLLFDVLICLLVLFGLIRNSRGTLIGYGLLHHHPQAALIGRIQALLVLWNVQIMMLHGHQVYYCFFREFLFSSVLQSVLPWGFDSDNQLGFSGSWAGCRCCKLTMATQLSSLSLQWCNPYCWMSDLCLAPPQSASDFCVSPDSYITSVTKDNAVINQGTYTETIQPCWFPAGSLCIMNIVVHFGCQRSEDVSAWLLAAEAAMASIFRKWLISLCVSEHIQWDFVWLTIWYLKAHTASQRILLCIKNPVLPLLVSKTSQKESRAEFCFFFILQSELISSLPFLSHFCLVQLHHSAQSCCL